MTSKTIVSHEMDDIQRLMYLDSLKRFREDEANIFRQVEERTRQYQALRQEYSQVYAKYARILKLCSTRALLLKSNRLDFDEEITRAKSNVKNIKQKLASKSAMTELLDQDELNICLQNLQSFRKLEELDQLRVELAGNNSAVRKIQSSIDAVESMLEMTTIQGIDHFVDELNEENFPNIPKV